MRMQQFRAGPDCGLRNRRSRVLAVRAMEYDAVSGKSVQIRSVVHAGVVGSEIIRTHRVDNKQEDVGPRLLRRSEIVDEFHSLADVGVADIRVFAQNAAEILAARVTCVTENVVSELEGRIVSSVFLEAEGDLVLSGAQRLAPEDLRELQGLVHECTGQQGSDESCCGITRAHRTQTVDADTH